MLKIAVTGPESTGKSVLSAQIAEYFHTTEIPEYARTYLQNFKGRYSIDDVVNIAKGQTRLIEEEKSRHPQVIVTDTEMTVCKVWTEYVFHRTPHFIEKALREQDFDIYLLCNIDLPWTYDPLRENPNINEREEIFHLYQLILNNINAPYGIVCGTGEQRFHNALSIIKPYIR